MKKSWIIGLGVAIAALLWLKQDDIRMRLLERAANHAMARDTMAQLGNDKIHVAFCGTGSPLPSRDRGEACTAILLDGKMFVFDSGEGAARTLSLMGLSLGALQGVWLTHLHSDHFQGLGNLMLQRWAGTSAAAPLRVFGPAGTNDVVRGLNLAFRHDGDFRIAHHGAAIVPPSGFGMTASEIAPGIVYEAEGVKITALAVNHAPVAPSFAYRIDARGQCVVISGDIAYFPPLANFAKGCALLVHEVLSPRMVAVLAQQARAHGLAGRAKILRDIPGYHSSAADVARIATAAGIKHVALTHIVPSVPNALAPAVLDNVGKRFDGSMELMRDGDVISIARDGGITTTNVLR